MILDRIESEIVLTREFMERSEERFREGEGRYRDELQITREVIRRNELAFQEAVRLLTRLAERIEAATEETRAQTRGIYALIDRLESGGTAPAS